MKQNGAITILRWGIAFVFFYGSLVALVWPERSLVHIPEFLTSLVPGRPILATFSLYELVLSGFLFWGRKLFWSSLLATLTFIVIIIIDFQAMSQVFPFIGLACASLALFEISRQENHTNHDILE